MIIIHLSIDTHPFCHQALSSAQRLQNSIAECVETLIEWGIAMDYLNKAADFSLSGLIPAKFTYLIEINHSNYLKA